MTHKLRVSRAQQAVGTWLSATLVMLAFALPHSRNASAQAPPAPPGVTIAISVEPEEPRVGDRVRVTIAVEHPADRLVTTAVGLSRRPDLEVVSSEPPTTLPIGERLQTTFAFTLQPFALGRLDVGQVRLQLLTEDGAVREFPVVLPPIAVRSTLDPARADLRPLKPQAEIGGAPAAWERTALFGGVAAAVSIVLLLAALALRARLREAARPLLAPLPAATAEDDARRQLDALRAHDLLAIPDLEGYYGRLSSAVRDYLQERFDFRATALTTRELEHRMGAEGLDRWQSRLVSGLLERCDAAVYARVYPPLASADHDLTVAYEIVELARPRRETDAQAVPA